MPNVIIEVQVPGPAGGPYTREYVNAASMIFLTPDDRSKDYFIGISNPNTNIALPAATEGGAYHIKALFTSGQATISADEGIENDSPFIIYAGESVDLYPFGGAWRIF